MKFFLNWKYALWVEEKEKQRIEDRKSDDKDYDGVSSEANKRKLKASDVYSDDSGSDSD